MASVEIHPDRVVIRLSAAEKALAFRKRDIVLDREAITSVLITDDPWVWLRGVRSPGAHLPRTLALGTWRASGGKDFIVVRSKRPAVVIDFDTEAVERRGDAESLDGSKAPFDAFARVVLSTRHAADVIKVLRGDDSTAVFEVGTSTS